MNSIFSCSFPKPALQSNSTEKKTPLNSSRTAAARKAAMISLNCLSINRPQILASALPTNNTTSQSLPNLPPLPSKPSNPTIPPLPKLEKTEQKQRPKKRQPSVLEIERAIGAGIFRDRDPDSEENLTLFDKIFLKSVGKTEGSVEKQLRETGEWIGDRSEKTFRSAAKPILMFVFQWVFPVWICGFLIASGIIKLPFNSPFLDDLIMVNNCQVSVGNGFQAAESIEGVVDDDGCGSVQKMTQERQNGPVYVLVPVDPDPYVSVVPIVPESTDSAVWKSVGSSVS